MAKTDGTENDKNRDSSIIAAATGKYFSYRSGVGDAAFEPKLYRIDFYP